MILKKDQIYKNYYFDRIGINNKNRDLVSSNTEFYLRVSNRILDSLNISMLILIFFMTFLSFNSQREWTNYYKLLVKTRNINNNLIHHISKTEEFYLKEIETLENIKYTTSEDLIYLSEFKPKYKKNSLKKYLKNISNGLKDGLYKRGY